MSALAELLLRSTIVLAMAALAAAMVQGRGGSASMRFTIWILGFAALAVLPFLVLALPSLTVPVLPADPAPTAAVANRVTTAVAGSVAPWRTSSLNGLHLAYAFVALLLVMRLALARLVVERLWAAARPISDPQAIATVRTLSTSCGMGHVEVRVSEAPVVPMTWGTLKPRILVPSDARAWPLERWRSVLLHELGHVSRRDSLSSMFAEVVCALYWLHPGVWQAKGRMRLAQEQACDDLVLGCGASPACYARHLLESAGAVRRPRAALAMASPIDLERRLQAILASRNRRIASRRFLASAALVALGTAPLIAAIVPVRADARPEPLRPVAVVPTKSSGTLAVPRVATEAALIHNSVSHRIAHVQARVSAQPATLSAPVPLWQAGSLDEQYEGKLVRFNEEVAAYAVKLAIYNEQLRSYRVQNDHYARQVQAWHTEMALIGPNPRRDQTIPTYPTAPTAPTAPTYPVAPVRPPTPPHSS